MSLKVESAVNPTRAIVIPPFPMFMASAQVEAGHPLRLKWGRVRPRLDQDMARISLALGAIADFNRSINSSIAYKRDPLDNWQPASETLRFASGDCEDMAIVKYATLFASGLSEQRMCMVLADVINVGHHAFLVIERDGLWVLDNKFDHLIKPEKYIGMTPLVGCSGDDVFRYGRAFTLAQN